MPKMIIRVGADDVIIHMGYGMKEMPLLNS